MNIALCGTHGVGKTTLLNKVWDRVVGDPWFEGNLGEKLSEQARTVADSMGLRSLADIPLWTKAEIEYFQWLVFINQVAHERQAAQRRGGFLSDRSVVDNYAYITYYQCSSTMQDAVRKFCYQHAPSYDILFYMPIPMQLDTQELQDGFRMTALQSIIDVDGIMQELFRDFSEYTHVVTLSHDRDKWADEVFDAIEDFCLTSA